MPLYVNLRRIYAELAAAGFGDQAALSPEQLFPFDQLHYHGTDAVRRAAGLLGLAADSRVLEVGSGFGGPARYLAHTIGCQVTALDIQPEMHAVASELTARCGLASHVTHVCGDALVAALPDGGFDAVVSWMAIHHIPDRPRLFERLARLLRSGGGLYIEDLYQRAPFSAADELDARDTIHGVTLTSVEEYEGDLCRAGFGPVALVDMTADWAAFCARRAAGWQSDHARHVRVHGEATCRRLEQFFLTVARLFEHGGLGGLRVSARL